LRAPLFFCFERRDVPFLQKGLFALKKNFLRKTLWIYSVGVPP